MRKSKRSAFTIVELVIVIAVIAILSAVLIPTFGAIIKNANVASDQATAATLTSELHVYLKGETIDSEEELMDVLSDAKSGIGKKLVPKALNYGHHFWFDMENQMIVAGYAEDIEKIGKEETPTAKSKQEDGIALTAAVLTADVTVESSFGGLRNLFPHNDYYLITAESALSSIFGDMSAIENAQEYLAFLTDLSDATGDEVFGNIATYVFNNVKKTVIINSHGMFHYADVTDASVYFAPGVQVIKANRIVYDEALNGASDADEDDAAPTIAGNEINLPSSVLLVEANALDLGSSVVIKTNCADYNAIASIFAPKSTDAVVADKSNNQYIVTVGPEDGDANKGDTDVLHTKAGVWKCNLVPKAPFETWSIAYGLTDDAQNTENEANSNWYYYSNTDDVLYVAYAANTEFYIEGSNGVRSDAVKSWTSSNHEVMTDDLAIVGGGETTISATVKDLYGKETTQSITVRVNTARSANVNVESATFNLDGTSTHNVNWHYSGTNPIDPDVNGTITYNYNYAKGSEELTIGINNTTDSMLEKSEDGTTIGRSALTSGQAKFTLSVDGMLTTTFDVNIIDNSTAPLQVNFHDKSQSDVYKYYIGDNNAINLGALFGLKSDYSSLNLAGATLNIYDAMDANQVGQHINGLSNGVNATFGTPASNGVESTVRSDHNAVVVGEGEEATTTMVYNNPWTLSSDWSNQVIEFTGLESNATSNVWIQISPVNHSAIFIKFTLVDATNVTSTASNNVDTTATTLNTTLANASAVLFSDFTATTGQTISIGAGKTLYGNGYKIDAREYVAQATTISYTWCTKCNKVAEGNCLKNSAITNGWQGHYKNGENSETRYYSTPDQYLVSIEGGNIDNIYINGPVYPELQYSTSDYVANEVNYTLTGYYVSGIKSTGTSTISNSYVKGFRQPIAVDDGTLNLTNSTLYGGTYANLQLNKGTLNLTDVTTVQPNTGIRDTFNVGNDVIGLGIVVEASAVDGSTSAINVSGYLDQYNWVSSDTEADLPKLTIDGTEIDFKVVLASMFKGIKVAGVTKEMGFLEDYIETIDGVEYLNAGIMFVAIDTGNVASNAKTNVSKLTVTDTNRITTTGAKLPRFTATTLPLFSQYLVINAGDTIQLYANQMVRALEVFSVDNNGYATADAFSIMGTGALTDDNPIDVFIKVWSYDKDNVTLGSTTPINYPSTGYYANYGN